MNWFADCRTLDDAKTEYRRLCFVHHPDRGGDPATMQQINQAYHAVLKYGIHGTPPPPGASVPRRYRQPVAPHPPTADAAGSQAYIRRLWEVTPWQALPNGARRIVGRHTISVVRFGAAPQMWAVQVDDRMSMWAYETRAQAEEDGFNLLVEVMSG